MCSIWHEGHVRLHLALTIKMYYNTMSKQGGKVAKMLCKDQIHATTIESSNHFKSFQNDPVVNFG